MTVHPRSGLLKASWTDADFSDMGWHDCVIHAISVTEYEDSTLPPVRLLLDLDYIVRWVDPVRPARHFTFWIAPATLVFDRAWDITGEFGLLNQALDIADLHRLASPDGGQDPLWHIEGHSFDIRLRGGGYRQFLRRPPRQVRGQRLTMAQRGGLSFAEQAFA